MQRPIKINFPGYIVFSFLMFFLISCYSNKVEIVNIDPNETDD